MEAECRRRVPSVVGLYSVPDLFQRLCASVLKDCIIQPTSRIDFCFQKPIKKHDKARVQSLVRKLRALCMDVVLLRKWEWMRGDGDSVIRCFGVALSLYFQGMSKEAECLAAAISKVLKEDCQLVEAENVLQFLFLLSSSRRAGNLVPEVRKGHIYSYYPRYVCMYVLL